jgi:serine/threonine protein kinase
MERAVDQRSAFLGEACEGDDELRRQLELLLSHSDSTDIALGSPVWEVVARVAETSVGLTAGTRLGPYEIIGPLGEGAMGTVYHALDTRLGRAVAIKVCTEQFSARFEREARAISALNHPNICTLYDVGPNFLVMELVEGETLAQRLDRAGPSPLAEVFDIGLKVAQALEEAHHKGIIHRDLKPANVKITPEGRVKVLDFGLAKTMREERTDANTPAMTTVTGIGTAAGQLVGTPAYMSPEQASGKDVDTRTDVWAFGCLLYELLTGTRAFRGETSGDTIAAILDTEPDWRVLPAATPAKIRDLLRQCLEKDAVRRLLDIPAARTAIENAKARRTRVPTWGQALAISALVAAMVLAAWFLRGHEAQPARMLHAVPLTSYLGSQDWPSFSPDGNQVAFAWDGEKEDNFAIYVKPIGPGTPLRLTHASAADTNPAWSPDGNSIAFLRASRPGKSAVVLIPPLGGAERGVTEVVRGNPLAPSLAWLPDSKWLVVFDRPPSQAAGLWLLSTVTGERRRLTTALEGPATGDFSPAVAPDGRTVAFARASANNSSDLYLLMLGGDLRPHGAPRRLTKENEAIDGLAWTADGRELIFSSGEPGNLSLFRIATSGDTHRKRLTEQQDIFDMAISGRSKRLVFVRSRREMDIYRVELAGEGNAAPQSIPLITSSRLDRFPRYSPDGKKVALSHFAPETGSFGSAIAKVPTRCK